jgi:hypothetical protein
MLKVRLQLDRPTDNVLAPDRKGNKAEQARVKDCALARHQVSASDWRDQAETLLRRLTRLTNAAARSRRGMRP